MLEKDLQALAKDKRNAPEIKLGRALVEAPFWIISDTHFFHRNIIDYCDRPENHDQLMLDNWQEMIADDAPILHLGDFALGPRGDIEELAPKLPGNKYLLMGNHDRRGKRFYYELGFTIVDPFMLDYKGKKLVFSHYPDYQRKFIQYPNHINIHGHIHEKTIDDPQLINVSVEQTDYRPLWLPDLLEDQA
jgi:calcineurin-like phosphoesterase family protein